MGEVNSGKSTLFNRLIKEKKAITSEIAGTTRDWVSAKTNFKGKNLELIDTAGFLEHEENDLEKEIKKVQAQKIKEADLYLIVADSKESPTARIKNIINELRNYNKPIILVINKVDNPNLIEEKKRQFASLGLEKTIIISALLGRNVDELKDLITKNLNVNEEDSPIHPTHPNKIAIIGRPNVGKSTLLNALTVSNRALTSEQSGTTRDELEADLGSQISLIDTPGLKRSNKIKNIIDFFASRRSIFMSQNADLAILVLSAEDGLVHQEFRIARLIKHYQRPLIVVINKIDKINENELTRLKDYVKYRFKFLGEFPIYCVSAKDNENIDGLRQEIIKKSQEL